MNPEEKQALIAYCEEVQGNNPESSDAYKVISIALAALTAQPVAWLVEFHEPMTDDYCSEVKTVQLEKPTGHYMECATPLIRAAGYEVQE